MTSEQRRGVNTFIEWYRKRGMEVELVDERETRVVYYDGVAINTRIIIREGNRIGERYWSTRLNGFRTGMAERSWWRRGDEGIPQQLKRFVE